jgi:hypothetical protein
MRSLSFRPSAEASRVTISLSLFVRSRSVSGVRRRARIHAKAVAGVMRPEFAARSMAKLDEPHPFGLILGSGHVGNRMAAPLSRVGAT